MYGKYMNISEKKLAEFTELFKDKPGNTLTANEALAKASTLLRIVKILYRPIRKSDYNALHSDSLLLPFKGVKVKKRDY